MKAIQTRLEELENQMEFVRRVVEEGHAKRKEKQLKVRQPLKEAIVTQVNGDPLNSGLENLIRSRQLGQMSCQTIARLLAHWK